MEDSQRKYIAYQLQLAIERKEPDTTFLCIKHLCEYMGGKELELNPTLRVSYLLALVIQQL